MLKQKPLQCNTKLIAFIKRLQQKKYRQQEKAFVVQGAKSIITLLDSDYSIQCIVGTEAFIQTYEKRLDQKHIKIFYTNEQQLSSLGSFQTNNACLAIVNTKPNIPLWIGAEEYGLVLDDIRDPGNFGSILRIASWYGIQKLIVSNTSVDLYNPKVIQASMGSFTQVQVYYTDLATYLKQAQVPVLGAYLDAESLYHFSFPQQGLIVIGNESLGIHANLLPYIHYQLAIPRYGTASSLNAAIATAIFCDHWRSQQAKS